MLISDRKVEIPTDLSFNYDPKVDDIIYDSSTMQFGLKQKQLKQNMLEELIERLRIEKVKIY